MTYPTAQWPHTWPPAPWDWGVRWHLEQVEAPSEPALDLEFVKTKHLKLTTGSTEDVYIDGLIATAHRMAEKVTRRALMPQTWRWVGDMFPAGEIVLDKPPLLEVVSIEYVDDSGVEQTLDASAYQVVAPRGPEAGRGRVCPVASSSSWPSTQSGTHGAVAVTFRCGYEDTSSPPEANVPEDIKHGMLLLIGEMYKQRSESVIGFGTSSAPAILRARDIFKGYTVY